MRALLLALAIFFAAPASAGKAPTFEELEESLTCQCGCGLIVRACNHLQCPSAIPLRQEIREQMARGLDKEAILAYFADKYGEKILSSPTTTGFNLTAWVMPFVMVAVGGTVVVVTLLRWRRLQARRTAGPIPALKPTETGATAAYEKILERELKRFET